MRRIAATTFILLCPAAVSLADFPGGNAYIAGRNAENAARYADAISSYEACAGADPGLAGFARTRAAVCRGRAGDTTGAERLLRGLMAGDESDNAFVLMARAELAVLLARENHVAEAATLLRPIVESPIGPKWLNSYKYTYGDCLIASPDHAMRAQGFALFAAMLADARTRSQRLEAANRLAASPDPAQQLDAARAYVSADEWKSADRVLTSLASLPPEKRGPIEIDTRYLRARYTLATNRDSEAGRAALLAVAKASPGTEAGRLALMHAARSYFTAGQEPRRPSGKVSVTEKKRREVYRDTAATLFNLMAERMPDARETGDALWWLANRHLDRDDDPREVDAALAELQRLAALCPQHDRAPDALFRAALIVRGKGDAQQAADGLKCIVKQYPKSHYAAAAAYDCGRICLASNDPAHAAEMFKQAVDLGGIGSFYAHRASQRLAEMDGKDAATASAIRAPGISGYLRPIAVDVPVSAPRGLNDPWLARLRFFASHGYEDAEWEVLANIKRIMGPQHTAAYLAAIADAGLAATVDHIIARTKWGMTDDRPTPEALPALYPRAYWPTVQSTAREIGADPMLLLAIARQESLFQARIESNAGATGVMQLMPSTAAWIAKIDADVGAGHSQRLDSPDSSFRLGGFYYRYILGKQDGNTVYAIASYNAGPGNVNKWRARTDSTDLDNFIEAIPFDETRGFVKSVLGNFAAYHSIYPAASRLAEISGAVSAREDSRQ